MVEHGDEVLSIIRNKKVLKRLYEIVVGDRELARVRRKVEKNVLKIEEKENRG